ncbi:MAG: hypothetical protein D4R68_04700 [Ignavibacteriales bacterium]|nr:MAG: hypothetical protein D4R68_04700 [Ignavibacteriales bacterium]
MDLNINSDTKLNELTVADFKLLISESVKDILENLLEDMEASQNKSYLNSIREAREDYKAGRLTSLDDLENV